MHLSQTSRPRTSLHHNFALGTCTKLCRAYSQSTLDPAFRYRHSSWLGEVGCPGHERLMGIMLTGCQGFKKAIDRTTTTVMIKTGMYQAPLFKSTSKRPFLRCKTPCPDVRWWGLTDCRQAMSRRQATEIMRSKKGKDAGFLMHRGHRAHAF